MASIYPILLLYPIVLLKMIETKVDSIDLLGVIMNNEELLSQEKLAGNELLNSVISNVNISEKICKKFLSLLLQIGSRNIFNLNIVFCLEVPIILRFESVEFLVQRRLFV